MRRGTLLLLLFFLVIALSVLSAASWLDAGNGGHHALNSFPVKDGSYQQDNAHVLLLANKKQQFFLVASTPVGHRQSEWHARDLLTPTPTSSICSTQQITQLLLKPGALEIWNTGAIHVPTNSPFDPHNYPLTIAYGKPLFTGADLDPNSLSMGWDQMTGYYFVNFSMKSSAALKLTYFTSHHIGRYITVTLGRVVISSLAIHYTLPGKGQFQMSPHSLALSGVKCTEV